MLHRDVLAALDSIAESPFSPDAKRLASAAASENGFCLPGGAKLDPEALLLLWRCVAAARGAGGSQQQVGEFVATLPTGIPRGARPTDIVVAEMIGSATRRVVVFGYMFTTTSGVIELLAAAALRSARVRIVCDRKDGGKADVQRAWPSFAPRPEVFVNAESSDAFAKMHSKLLIVDDDDILITSANFTYHGMFGNIEFGVRLRGTQSAAAADAFVSHLIETSAIVGV